MAWWGSSGDGQLIWGSAGHQEWLVGRLPDIREADQNRERNCRMQNNPNRVRDISHAAVLVSDSEIACLPETV